MPRFNTVHIICRHLFFKESLLPGTWYTCNTVMDSDLALR